MPRQTPGQTSNIEPGATPGIATMLVSSAKLQYFFRITAKNRRNLAKYPQNW